MAIIRNYLNEDEENLNPTTNTQSSVVGSGAGNPNDSKAEGTSWTNLQQYLKANEGEGDDIANSALKSTQDRIDSVGSDILNWQTKAKESVDKSVRKDDWSSKIKNADVNGVKNIDSNAFNEWKNLSNYWGANDASGVEGYSDVYKKVGDVKDVIPQTDEWYSQKVLLKKANDGKRYTDGMNMLDLFVARADEDGKKAFSDFQVKNKDFGSKFDSSIKDVNSYIGAKNTQGQKSYDDVMSAIAQKNNEIRGGISGRNSAETDRAFNLAKDKIDATLTQNGINPSDIMNYNDFIEAPEMRDTDLLTQAEIDALNSLAGLEGKSGNLRKSNYAYNINWDKVNAMKPNIAVQENATVATPGRSKSEFGKAIEGGDSTGNPGQDPIGYLESLMGGAVNRATTIPIAVPQQPNPGNQGQTVVNQVGGGAENIKNTVLGKKKIKFGK